MQSTWTNLIHSLKTHCFDCVKQSCRLQVIFYLREFCSLDTDSIKFLISWSNRCHKNVWIYYYYYVNQVVTAFIFFEFILKLWNMIMNFKNCIFCTWNSIFSNLMRRSTFFKVCRTFLTCCTCSFFIFKYTSILFRYTMMNWFK